MQHWIQCKTLEMMDHPLPAAETEHSPEGGGESPPPPPGLAAQCGPAVFPAPSLGVPQGRTGELPFQDIDFGAS